MAGIHQAYRASCATIRFQKNAVVTATGFPHGGDIQPAPTRLKAIASRTSLSGHLCRKRSDSADGEEPLIASRVLSPDICWKLCKVEESERHGFFPLTEGRLCSITLYTVWRW